MVSTVLFRDTIDPDGSETGLRERQHLLQDIKRLPVSETDPPCQSHVRQGVRFRLPLTRLRATRRRHECVGCLMPVDLTQLG